MAVAGRVSFFLEQERFYQGTLETVFLGTSDFPFIVGTDLEMIQLVPMTFGSYKPVTGAL